MRRHLQKTESRNKGKLIKVSYLRIFILDRTLRTVYHVAAKEFFNIPKICGTRPHRQSTVYSMEIFFCCFFLLSQNFLFYIFVLQFCMF